MEFLSDRLGYLLLTASFASRIRSSTVNYLETYLNLKEVIALITVVKYEI